MAAAAGGADADPRARALARAGRELSRRPLSGAALRSRLLKVAPVEVCDAVMEDLAGLGLVDDVALARSVAERRLAEGWGPGRIQHDLERLGVDDGARAAALALADAGEVEAARTHVERRALRGAPQRAWATLARRGFREAAVEDALAGVDVALDDEPLAGR
jgi:SOS response regulatory protein OraA/RecX